MQQYGWVLFALVVLGPLAGAVLFDRLRLGRTASMAALAVLVGGAFALVLHGTNIATGTAGLTGPEIGAGGAVTSPASGSRVAAPITAAANREADAMIAADRINLERANHELGALREQLASLGAERQRAADALFKTRSELEAERSINAKVRQELGAVRGHVASLEAAAVKSEQSPAKLQSDLEGEREAHARTRNALQALREQLEGLETAKKKTAEVAAANAMAVLEAERGSHEKTRAALKAAEEQAASHDSARRLLDGELRKVDAELKVLRSARPVAAEAASSRIEDVRASTPGSTREPAAAPLISPAPFSAVVAAASAPAPAGVVATTSALAGVPASAAPTLTPAAASLRASMEAGLTNQNYALQALPSPELVQGQVGRYYRVVCRDTSPAGKRLIFDAGGYNLTGGEAKVDPCFKALQANILAAVPAGVTKVLYAQGHASTQGFARPQKLDAGDTHLKSLSFLPRTKDGRQFASKPEKQTVVATFLNKQLPVLRAGNVGDWVSTATKGALVPVLLEGEFKDTGDEASRSFEFIVYIKW